jgi:hypothetical protein
LERSLLYLRSRWIREWAADLGSDILPGSGARDPDVEEKSLRGADVILLLLNTPKEQVNLNKSGSRSIAIPQYAL